MWLALRSILWTILLPGMVAGFIPWQFFGISRVHPDFSDPLQLLGLALILAGVILLGTCIWEFAAKGRGTLSPADPTGFVRDLQAALAPPARAEARSKTLPRWRQIRR